MVPDGPALPAAHLLYAASLRLAAVPSAVSCSRMFIRQTLRCWHVTEHIDVAELVGSELVTNAVKATGVAGPESTWTSVTAAHVIGVQSRIIGSGLYVEVWDNGEGAPVARCPDADTEGGRGLLLIEAMADRWDVYRPAVGGKVVWAEVRLAEPPKPLPLPTLPVRVSTEYVPSPGLPADMASTALLQRVLDGLRRAC
ncbi:ATP-binding protein [Streptomyces koyangensis]|uniref:ATP-binding protein n=1 Tax=Streptomyces koyangensis TaxID=188770 RepID=UPI003D052783